MPQKLRVLQCFDCKTYQVDIVKITKRWSCKMCGAKQSVMKVFLCGTAADCRSLAQQMNMEKGLKEEKTKNEVVEFYDDEAIDWNTIEESSMVQNLNEPTSKKTTTTNKWAAYVEENEEKMAHKNRPASNEINNKDFEYMENENKWGTYVNDKNVYEKLKIVDNTFEIDTKSVTYKFDSNSKCPEKIIAMERYGNENSKISKNENKNKWTEYTEYQKQPNTCFNADKTPLELSVYEHSQNNANNECPIDERTYVDNVENVAQITNLDNCNKLTQSKEQSFKTDDYKIEHKRQHTDDIQLIAKTKRTSKWDKFL